MSDPADTRGSEAERPENVLEQKPPVALDSAPGSDAPLAVAAEGDHSRTEESNAAAAGATSEHKSVPPAQETVAQEPVDRKSVLEEPIAEESIAEESTTEEAAIQAQPETAPPAEEAQPSQNAKPEEVDAKSDEVSEPVKAASEAKHPAAKPPASDPSEPPQLPENVLPLVQAMNERSAVQGAIIGWNKGGFHVNLDGVPAFCPKSQIELGNPKRAAAYLDRRFDFRVLDIKDLGKRIVVSRRELLQEARAQAMEVLKDKQAQNEPLEGKVVSLTDFGAFVDVGGGVEGLVHLSQLSRRRVEHPRELLEIGQTVQVKVNKIEKGGERISLSMKALEPDPWLGINERYLTGEAFTGTIVRKIDFGLFVQLSDGLEGLVHSSQLALGKGLDDAAYEPGQQIEGWIREADEARKRLSLSLREVAKSNPWADLSSRYKEGDEVTGTVEQVAKFGVFVSLEPGLSGLLPFSSLSLPTGTNPRRLYSPGHEMRVVIDSVDVKKRRLSLAPPGARLEGTRSDYRNYKQTVGDAGSGLNAMAAAFGKLRQS